MATTAAIFKGIVSLQDGDGPLLSTGNPTKVQLTQEIEEKNIPNTRTPGGGNYENYKRVKAAKLSFQFRDLLKQVVEIVFGGKLTTIAGGAVTDEAHSDIVIGGLILTNKRQDMSAAMTVKKGATSLVEGTDYRRQRAGIVPLTGGSLIAGDDITMDYTSLTVTRIDGLMNTTKEFRCVFDGVNERNNQPVLGEFYRLAFGPASNIDLVGDDHVSFDVEAELLADDTKPASESPFYHFEMGGVS